MTPVISNLRNLLYDHKGLDMPNHIIQTYYDTYQKRLHRILFLHSLSKDLASGARRCRLWLDNFALPTEIYKL